MAYYFNLPSIDQLTIDQQAVLNEPRPIAVSGGPGTGKTVIALWRHIRNIDQEKKSLLLTYTKTLERYLIETAKSINENAAEEINRTLWWTTNVLVGDYDEIIIDEAQDVRINRYNILNDFTKEISYTADPEQSVFLSRKEVSELLRSLKELFLNNIPYELNDNFRNSYEIMLFVKAIFPQRNIPQNVLDHLKEEEESRGPKPILQITSQQNNIIIEIIKNFNTEATHNIAVLVPLVNAALHVERTVDDYYNMILEAGINCSKYTNENDDLLEIENVHITTFKSAKGLEFDTVIIPDFQDFNDNIDRLNVITENDYYVAFTRARRNLFIISNEELSFLNTSTLDIEKNEQNNFSDYLETDTDVNDDLPF